MKNVFILLMVLAITSALAQSNSTNNKPITSSPLLQTNALPFANAEWLTNIVSETETQPAEPARPGPLSDEAFAAKIRRDARNTPFQFVEPKPNEISIGKFSYSGILVELFKMPNPLQMINPFAPPEYGSGELNLVREPAQNRPVGLKFFAIQY